MPSSNSRKWQPIDLETPLTPLPINERIEAEPEESLFDDWGIESTAPMPRPTIETKGRDGAPSAHVVIQANPKPPRSSEMAPRLPPKRKRKVKTKEGEEEGSPEIKKRTTPSTSQQPWYTACKASSCPIKYPHNYSLSPVEPPRQHLAKRDLLAASDELGKVSKSNKKSTPVKQDTNGEQLGTKITEAIDEEDETLFLGRDVYMPPEVDSAEQRNIHHTSTSEDKKLLQAFYSAHGSKRQYYGFLGDGIQYHKHSDVNLKPLKSDSLLKRSQKENSKYKGKGKRENSKSGYRILPHG